MTKFNLDKLLEIAEPRKEGPKITPQEMEEKLRKLHEYFNEGKK